MRTYTKSFTASAYASDLLSSKGSKEWPKPPLPISSRAVRPIHARMSTSFDSDVLSWFLTPSASCDGSNQTRAVEHVR